MQGTNNNNSNNNNNNNGSNNINLNIDIDNTLNMVVGWDGQPKLDDDYIGPMRDPHEQTDYRHHRQRRRRYDSTSSGDSMTTNSTTTSSNNYNYNSNKNNNNNNNNTDSGASISGSASSVITEDNTTLEGEYEGDSGGEEASHATSNNSITSMDMITDQLAKELYELSMHERQRMLYDVHCVPDHFDDSFETEQRVLKEFNEWIQQHHHTEEASAYRMAEQLSKDYVESYDLRMQFLRAVMDYDIERAGARFFSFLEFKLQYFGRDKLVQKYITLDDLDPHDVECLQTGFFQILPVRDPGERPIFFYDFVHLKYATLANAMKATFYTLLAMHEDVDVQKKGIVLITRGLQIGSNMKYFGYQFLWHFAKLGLSSPSKPQGIHHMVQPGIGGTLISWFSNLLPQRARIRTRVHVGTYEENMTKLMSHGISTQFLPVKEEDGPLDTQWHHEWIEIRRKIESRRKLQQLQQQHQQQQISSLSSSSQSMPSTTTAQNNINNTLTKDDTENDTSHNDITDTDTDAAMNMATTTTTDDATDLIDTDNTIIVPSPKDILMGRGKRTMTSPGNIRLYMLLDDNFERYESSARQLKSTIAKEMVDLVKAQGCRFLEQVDGFWVQADDAKARNKISHDFRTLRSTKRNTTTTTPSKNTTTSTATTKNQKSKRKQK